MRPAWRVARLAEVIENAHDHGALDDKGDDLHAAAAARAAQRVDLIDLSNQPCPIAGAGGGRCDGR